MLDSLVCWFDASQGDAAGSGPKSGVLVSTPRNVAWLRVVPFVFLHVICLGVVWVGVSPTAVVVAVLSYVVRMFAITAFYHRYFSHKAFRTSRGMQFLFAVLGASATQRGPLWWAGHHRDHHRHADADGDPHRPSDGFFWSHVGWFLCKENFETDEDRVRDWQRYPELVWLNRFDATVPLLYAATLFALGASLARWFPDLGTDAWQLVIWGYFVSTVVLIHVTLLVNSMAHRIGRRPFATRDNSRNNAFLALMTLGEGWHNNHHRYAGAARQGFYWWQLDLSYYALKVMAWLGLIWDLKPVPEAVLAEGRL